MTVYGYARVSTAGQSLNRQKDTLQTADADNIMSEKYSAPRPHVLNLKN